MSDLRNHVVVPFASFVERRERRNRIAATLRQRDRLRSLLSEWQRYAGWLAKDHASAAVRADVQALGAAMDTENDTALLLLALDKDIGRLPCGGIRTMLRRTLGEIRAVLGPTGVEPPRSRRDRVVAPRRGPPS